MPADTGMEKPTASPIAGAPASASHTPDKPRSASEHRKVNGGGGGGGGCRPGRSGGSGAGWRQGRGRAESSKPIMEKRRRARINESLGQLKTLILDALKKDSSRHSKLEKADILEMTVKHLRNLQRAQMSAALSADPTVLGKYRAGFNECMNEVTRFLSTCEGVNADVRTRLLGHLSACLGQIVAMNYPAPPPPPPPAQPAHLGLPPGAPGAAGPVPCKLSPAEALSPKVYGGFQLVPATDGQFAFLIPSPAFPAGSGPLIPLYPNGSAAATPAASPVQGLTSFGGGVGSSSQAGSALGERSESVWRPW
ncbi:HES1 factor, partial [Spelaeornis formosus]|nr:HES1 factor [Elachura formosa]